MTDNTRYPPWVEQLAWNADGLLPVVTQEAGSGRMLTQAWMNREALLQTARQGCAIYWSRSRQALWRKGEASGHVQKVQEIRLDCDNDSLLLVVEQVGGIACHTGRHSCYYQRLQGDTDERSWQAVDPVLKDPAEMYK